VIINKSKALVFQQNKIFNKVGQAVLPALKKLTQKGKKHIALKEQEDVVVNVAVGGCENAYLEFFSGANVLVAEFCKRGRLHY